MGQFPTHAPQQSTSLFDHLIGHGKQRRCGWKRGAPSGAPSRARAPVLEVGGDPRAAEDEAWVSSSSASGVTRSNAAWPPCICAKKFFGQAAACAGAAVDIHCGLIGLRRAEIRLPMHSSVGSLRCRLRSRMSRERAAMSKKGTQKPAVLRFALTTRSKPRSALRLRHIG